MSRYPRVLRAAAVFQHDPVALSEALDAIPAPLTAIVDEIPSGVLLTLEVRRRWWDRRLRGTVVRELESEIDRVRSAAGRQLVVAAAIVRDGALLAARRTGPPELAGRWELPGGKLEPGESPETALVREIAEELDVELASVGPELTRRPLDAHRVLVVLAAELAPGGEPSAVEHSELGWFAPAELDDLDWLESNRPILPQVVDQLLSR